MDPWSLEVKYWGQDGRTTVTPAALTPYRVKIIIIIIIIIILFV